MHCADRSPPPVICAPTTAPTRPAAVTAMTANPASTLTRLTSRLEPMAAVADTPFLCASAPMAAICQTFPGTYFPRFETNQIRAAGENGGDSDSTRDMTLHPPLDR